MEAFEFEAEALEAFWRFVAERHRTYLLRRSRPTKPPWSTDPILQTYRFCNVFRELDATTVWLRERVRDRLAEEPARVLLATFAFRRFNRRRTGEALLRAGCFDEWNEKRAREALERLGPPYVSKAYRMPAQGMGLPRHEAFLRVISKVALDAERLALEATVQGMSREMLAYRTVGPFQAYEVATDLIQTRVLREAPDRDTWCNVGPGAFRGLNRLKPMSPFFICGQAEGLDCLLALHAGQDAYRDSPLPPLDLRAVEHSLCEFDKYERARTGIYPPRKFKPNDRGRW